MALLVAPYNPAMRLGMGLNSFTQQLCVNDAVKTPDGSASSPELFTAQRPKYREGLMSADDGSETISQAVTWTAKFVDRISEVTDSMNISGSLQIKCDAIGGGGGASASFMDSNKFKESDINYFIQVKVTNQQLVAPNLSEFCSIDGVRPVDFTRVYGDSFISGFIEGGEFNALVSIKLKDRSTAKDISGQLKVQLDLKTASVDGEAQGGVKKENKSIEGETTIAVSWTGGGDIKNGDVKDWTLDTLKAVALEFPEHVMACPMRTNAILTKYTGLNNFQKHVSQMGSPLDYENAGVYSSALLDAYMDYKVMWRNIQQGTARMLTQGAPAEQVPSDGSDAEAPQAVVAVAPHAADIDPPFPPNELVPYRADIFGLDRARKDCRFEMIKIVREVDAVANNPKVATDPFRNWQYLSPAIFRMLLPVRLLADMVAVRHLTSF
ncbi:hypothetical protein PHLGIDRAFT_79414 [Phlebiopsis gigantea 11061_1 CR5-6]|uniref:MACPF domain-containing protein n=1 Tax=Phlebiopsis gigantea (strain 11061_1 CR5-6) TaxID=745531 RepID=A0A0C3RQS7_PHLG1|nr:hypothetical protein PHLGIDRAFT_79414 [Phlebiopsis gigantea 11061_1 CR5-6]